MEILQSRHNPLIKTVAKLSTQRRERLKQGLMVLDGPHLIAAALDAGWHLERLLLAESAQHRAELQGLLRRHGQPAQLLADALFAELSELESISGILALCAMPTAVDVRKDGLVLALDGVQDPGNLGAILRTAAAAGVDQVWLGMGCADPWSPKVLRAGMGAQFVLPMVDRVPLLAAASAFSGIKAVTSLEGSVSLYQADLRGDLLLVMGSEGQGVSSELQALASLRLRIPMTPGIESLNVGAATAICLYERVRQAGLGH
ncbi:TrmH family RNA methyltransferase [Chitinimonas sp.]|uniref:TrmH family RNA methyltransferase n=1 Tax=Chitinimonas sp. TaxID=1934313 RepID=UPI0035AE258F